MANIPYPVNLNKILQKGLLDTGGLASNDIYAVAVSSTYTYSASHEHYNELSGVIGSPVQLSSETVSSAMYDSANITFSSMTSGQTINAVILYAHTGVSTTADLVAYIDNGSGIGHLCNGADATVTIDAGGLLSFPTTALYTSAANAILEYGILGTGGFAAFDLYAILATSSYTYSASHEHVDNLTGTSGAVQIAGEAIANNILNADTTSFTSVSAGTYTQVIVYQHTGSDATADLVCRLALDSNFVSGGSDDVDLDWDDTDGILKAVA
jgi:hypothetical protein